MSEPPRQPGHRCCPTCGRLFPAAHPSVRPYRPFCSRRCQLIDLGKWFNEEYVIHTPLSKLDHEPPEATPPLE